MTIADIEALLRPANGMSIAAPAGSHMLPSQSLKNSQAYSTRIRPPDDEPLWLRIMVSAFVLSVVLALAITLYVPTALALFARRAMPDIYAQ